jgi:ABC-type multidrug transport system ATPase subunit
MATLGQERTIILSTHIVADLGAGCRDLALLDGGKVVFRGSPVELLARAKGQVFEIATAAGESPPELDAEVVSSSSADGQTIYRFVAAKDARSTSSLPVGAREVESVTLEEGYLAFMTTRGRSEVAAQVEAQVGS